MKLKRDTTLMIAIGLGALVFMWVGNNAFVAADQYLGMISSFLGLK
ncbi:MAG: hypothetical protein KW806_03295 [Candidatus Yanofskybacteria bacterium]|nr:hypothetical protein [Candidatus Yanofskybacteria bacterium]MBX4211784.1 hypothetical protein [Candidatus Yanofskybacteria bacterium]